MRYATVIKEMNVLFNGQITVYSRDALIIQAIPVGGSMMPQNLTTEKIANLTGVTEVTPILFIAASSQNIVEPVPVNFSLGIPVQNWKNILGPIPLRGNVGRYPTNDSDTEVLVGPSLADQYNWTTGAEIQANGYALQISGVMNTNLALLSRSVVMPLELAQKIYAYPKSINIVAVKTLPNVEQENLTKQIMEQLTYGGNSYANALTESERNDIIQPVLEQIQLWNLGIQAVVFTISLILVMTVTVMSVSERRRDFATLDAMGAPLNYILRMVIFEAALIGVLGGIIGLALGSVVAVFLASVYTNIPVTMFFGSIFEIVPPLYLLQIFGSIVAVCCLGSLVPAFNAMRMRIVEVLRAEY